MAHGTLDHATLAARNYIKSHTEQKEEEEELSPWRGHADETEPLKRPQGTSSPDVRRQRDPFPVYTEELDPVPVQTCSL
jgi:hypothetical protein